MEAVITKGDTLKRRKLILKEVGKGMNLVKLEPDSNRWPEPNKWSEPNRWPEPNKWSEPKKQPHF